MIEGEASVTLFPVSGVHKEIRMHIARLGSTGYQMIIGTDALQAIGGSITEENNVWDVLIGQKRYRVEVKPPREAAVVNQYHLNTQQTAQESWKMWAEKAAKLSTLQFSGQHNRYPEILDVSRPVLEVSRGRMDT